MYRRIKQEMATLGLPYLCKIWKLTSYTETVLHSIRVQGGC